MMLVLKTGNSSEKYQELQEKYKLVKTMINAQIVAVE
jgi:hypothetical protein